LKLSSLSRIYKKALHCIN